MAQAAGREVKRPFVQTSIDLRPSSCWTTEYNSIGDQGASLIESLQMKVATELCEALKEAGDNLTSWPNTRSQARRLTYAG